jgi:acyl-CoA reductase-like NAD-dependent aldehyde dehydrogenase
MESTLYIDGVWCQSSTGKTYPVHNPATGELVAKVADGTREDTARAVAAAAKAFPEWAARPARQRGALLDKAYHLMLERKEHLARTLTLEEGKPLGEKSTTQRTFCCGTARRRRATTVTWFPTMWWGNDRWPSDSRWAWWGVSPRGTSRPPW